MCHHAVSEQFLCAYDAVYTKCTFANTLLDRSILAQIRQ